MEQTEKDFCYLDRYQGLLENELFLVKVDSNEIITESGISKLTTC